MGNVRTSSKKRILLIGLGMALVIITVCVLEITNITHIFEKNATQPTSASQNTKGEPSSNNTSSQKQSSDSAKSAHDKSSEGQASTTATLLVPAGNFVSNHRPNLSGSPAPNTLTSVCTTTPGASCKIVFTKDGVSRALPSQITDSGGSTYWTWKLQDIGIGSGSWKIEAIASLNGQAQTASDAIMFEVAP